MDYEIKKLSEELFFIRWYRTPPTNSKTEQQFLEDLSALLAEATTPIYFISDLRKGRIASVRTLQKLGQMTVHEKWGGSTAFTQDPMTALFVQTFRAFAAQPTRERNEMMNTPEEALSYLETLKEGITEDIDWAAIINTATPTA